MLQTIERRLDEQGHTATPITQSSEVTAHMQTDVLTAEATHPAVDAAAIMAADDAARGYVLVCSNGRPVGIVTEGDLVRAVLATDQAGDTQLAKIMSHPLITVEPNDDLLDAAQRMASERVRKLPVLKDGVVRGMITAQDIARQCGTRIERALQSLTRWTPILGNESG
jgi:CBS domain-containing protein